MTGDSGAFSSPKPLPKAALSTLGQKAISELTSAYSHKQTLGELARVAR